jgi:hypothetical protein
MLNGINQQLVLLEEGAPANACQYRGSGALLGPSTRCIP